MDLIDETLTTHSMNQQLLPSIHVAAGLTKKTLNHYYELTDSSAVYRIAMGMFFFIFMLILTII